MDAAKKTKGRQKVEMKPITEMSKRHVAFSKRKAGLFNKAAELNILTGAEVAAIVFSPQGKAFSLATPAADSAFSAWIRRRHGAGISLPPPNFISPAADGGAWRELRRMEDANRRLADRRRGAEKARLREGNLGLGLGLGFYNWWDLPESCMETDDELAAFEAALVEMRNKVAERAAGAAAAAAPAMEFMGFGDGNLVAESDIMSGFVDVSGGRGGGGNGDDVFGLVPM